MVRMATDASLGVALPEPGGLTPVRKLFAVKAPVFSMAKLLSVDAVLGPEMKSTGEAMGIAEDLASAQYKAFLSTMDELPPDGAALCSIADADKAEALPIVAALHELGLKIFATAGTARFLSEAGVAAVAVDKLREGHPNVIDVIRSGAVDLVVNTVSGNGSARDAGLVTLRDGYEIRRASVERRIPCLTSLDTARSLVEALRHVRHNPRWQVAALTEYRSLGVPQSVTA
jgi:carbamoyl-phosphate synthase large subunit